MTMFYYKLNIDKKKNSELITDQSINFNDDSTRSHFFGNFKNSTENYEYQLNIEVLQTKII